MLKPQSSLWGSLDGKTQIGEVRKMDIQCPGCGHAGTYKAAVWGTALVDQDEDLKDIEVQIDEKDYFQCPECDFETYDRDEFYLDRP